MGPHTSRDKVGGAKGDMETGPENAQDRRRIIHGCARETNGPGVLFLCILQFPGNGFKGLLPGYLLPFGVFMEPFFRVASFYRVIDTVRVVKVHDGGGALAAKTAPGPEIMLLDPFCLDHDPINHLHLHGASCVTGGALGVNPCLSTLPGHKILLFSMFVIAGQPSQSIPFTVHLPLNFTDLEDIQMLIPALGF